MYWASGAVFGTALGLCQLLSGIKAGKVPTPEVGNRLVAVDNAAQPFSWHR